MTEHHDPDRDDRVIIDRERETTRETTTGSGGVIALIVAVVAIVLIVWFVMVSGNGTAGEENGNGDVDITVPTTVVP